MEDEFKISEPPKINVIPEKLGAQQAAQNSAGTQPSSPKAHIGKKPIIAAAIVIILVLAGIGIVYSGVLKQLPAPSTSSTTAPTTVTVATTTSTTTSTTVTTSIIPTKQVNFYISVKDPNDTYRRYMRLYIDQQPGAYRGNGLYANTTNYSVIINNSVGTIGLPAVLQIGVHKAYLVLSQTGGSSYGTYSGNVIAEEFTGGSHVNTTFNVSGIDFFHPANFTFNVT